MTLLPIELPQVAAIQGRWQLGLRAEPQVASALWRLAELLLPHWVALGAGGGCVLGSVPVDAALLVAGPDTRTPAGVFQVRLEADALSPRALQILRSGLLWHSARRLLDRDGAEPLDEALRAAAVDRALGDATLWARPISSQGEAALAWLSGADPGSDGSDVSMYPPVHDAIADRVVSKPQPGRLRRCIVTFAEPVDAPLLTELAACIAPWVALLEQGGFEQPSAFPGVRSCSFAGVQIFEHDSAEVVVDRFDAAEGAWSVLANLLGRFSALHRVVSIEVC